MPTQLPPGLTAEGPIIGRYDGGQENWFKYESIKLYTNAFIREDGRILLGYKKRGFGVDLYNGFGGKVEPGETPLEAAIREMEEEAGIIAPLEKCGTLFFVAENSEQAFHIDIFVAEEYKGSVTESDEMRPQWFSSREDTESAGLPPIPYDQMWPDDVFWLPMLLAKKPFIGRADFDKDGKMSKWWFAELQ